MERSEICLGRNTKQQQNIRMMISNNTTQRIQEMNVYKFKDSSAGAGFSWPPRCYSCSFCRREFRSAQALGGHMNVHRRDRARLRQFSPPKINLDPDPSFMPSHLNKFPLFPSSHDSYFSSCLDSRNNGRGIERSREEYVFFEKLKPSSGDLMKMETQKAFNKSASFICEKGCEIVKKDLVRLDLEIGLISHGELDLELRLGYT